MIVLLKYFIKAVIYVYIFALPLTSSLPVYPLMNTCYIELIPSESKKIQLYKFNKNKLFSALNMQYYLFNKLLTTQYANYFLINWFQ